MAAGRAVGPRIGTLNGIISTLNGIISTLNGIISTLNGVISTLNGIISTLNGVISTLNGIISTLNGIISSPWLVRDGRPAVGRQTDPSGEPPAIGGRTGLDHAHGVLDARPHFEEPHLRRHTTLYIARGVRLLGTLNAHRTAPHRTAPRVLTQRLPRGTPAGAGPEGLKGTEVCKVRE